MPKGLRVMQHGALAIMLCALTACASRPVGVLEPVAPSAASGGRVNLLVATTRAPSGDAGTLFSGERGDALSLTDMAISIPPADRRQVGQVQWPQRLPPDPATDFTSLRVSPLDGTKQARVWLNANLPRTRRVLIFVHGFNTRFEDAVFRFAQIVYDSGTDAAPILFTWPSRARIFDYLYDRESTNVSRDAFERLLRQVAGDPRVGEITVMAHSMGGWLLMETLRQMSIRDGRLPAKIQNLILASPDLDVDVFTSQWQSIGKPRPRSFVFVSQRDRALGLSRRLSGNISRLGSIDPTADPYRAAIERSGIVVIDLSDIEGRGRLHHSTFADNPEVVQLIGNRLIAGQTITDGDASLGERISGAAMGLGTAVGSVAGAVISAPIAALDPKTRRNYGDQVEMIGHSLDPGSEIRAPQ